VFKLRKAAANARNTGNLHCAFCGREPGDVNSLIEGPKVCICDECIATCADMLDDDNAEPDEPTVPADDEDPVVEPASASIFFRLLNEADVARLLDMDELIDLMTDALRRFSAGQVVQPVRTVVTVGTDRQFLGVMPAYVRDLPAIGAKVVTVFPGNAALDLPTHLATILLFSPQTGALVSAVDGRYITATRTAAVSAVSANLLARDEASVMGIVGSGLQARSHLEALETVFDLTEVRVWSPTTANQDRFLDDMRPTTKARLVGVDSAEQAVSGADLVVLATSSSQPVVQNEWVKAGAHVISVGACRPDQREMDPDLIRRGRLFVDSRESAFLESGDVVMGIADGHFTKSIIVGELGELADGKVEGRRSPREVTIFKSLGLAVEDVMAAELVYRRAVERGVGLELEL
jgi:alanine dehydrogenase